MLGGNRKYIQLADNSFYIYSALSVSLSPPPQPALIDLTLESF